MDTAMIIESMSSADPVSSSYAPLNSNVSSFKEKITILQLVISRTTTKCSPDWHVVKSSYARFIKKRNEYRDSTLMLNNTIFLKIKSDIFQLQSQPTVLRCVLNAGDIYVYYNSVIERAQNEIIIKSLITNLQRYHIYKSSASLIIKSCKPILTVNYSFDEIINLNQLELNNKKCYRTSVNKVSTYDLHTFCCNESDSRRITCTNKESNVSNNKKQLSLGNSRAVYCSSGTSGESGGILVTQECGSLVQYILILLLSLSQVCWTQALLVEPKYAGLDDFISDSSHKPYTNTSIASGTNVNNMKSAIGLGRRSENLKSPSSGVISYMNKMNNLERSVAAVLIKVAYGTTSTTKRSIPDNSYVATITTIATPPLTTLRYAERSSHNQEVSIHLRNYELDLERDHALPTSAPNADILKSNNNPMYPNPNKHYNHERDRQQHAFNTTPLPTLSNAIKKNIGQLPTIPMYPGDIPSYSPPARSFFTPPLPPEYQSPFADKPTLRGTNNEGVIANTGSYINRRPIPPPSLMPGQERVPYRPSDLLPSTGTRHAQVGPNIALSTGENKSTANIRIGTFTDKDLKKALNTPSESIDGYAYAKHFSLNASSVDILSTDSIKNLHNGSQETLQLNNDHTRKHSADQEVLPGIRRILSGSNGKNGEIPEVLLKQATSRPIVTFKTSPSPPMVTFNSTNKLQIENGEDNGLSSTSNINKSKSISAATVERNASIEYKLNTKSYEKSNKGQSMSSKASGSSSVTAAEIEVFGGADSPIAATTTTTSTMTSATLGKNPKILAKSMNGNSENGTASSTSSSVAASVSHSTWAVAWNIHIYFSVILFTILAVYSFYKLLTYNKLTHLFSQSYFICIHIILILICSLRIFYLCYDAYNIHATFNFFVSELLLYMPATFLTISFSVLMLYLFLKACNHKTNRYSVLIRPLTVTIGCGVHVVLCITLHYVESYTLNNHMHHQLLYQQQQQLYRRQIHHHHQQNQHEITTVSTSNFVTSAVNDNAQASLVLQSAAGAPSFAVSGTLPPRVLSLLCQIIYIFMCLFLGFLYLYLYRVLKQILRNKSQNYIHGYQNLSYAIHITIATAFLFVLLAALQIFGAISISTTRPPIQKVTAEIDWLQWSYQFSLRLIEIAIIILLSWVAGLETGSGSAMVSGATTMSNRDTHYGLSGENFGHGVAFGSRIATSNREKHIHHQFHHNHSNVAGFFLPCTSTSSQEQFETDYPAVCNANTNLHMYTMRTGKLIYDDTFALNSLSGNRQSQLLSVGNSTIGNRNAGDCQMLTQPTYQRPYDSGSLSSNNTNHNANEYYSKGTLTGDGSGCYTKGRRRNTDYYRDASTDHYENPNIELHCSVSSSGFGAANDSGDRNFPKTSAPSTTASSSGGSGSSAVSQQQILLIQSESCYSEPLSPANGSIYNFNNAEIAMRSGVAGNSGGKPNDYWLESHHGLVAPRVLDSYSGKNPKIIHPNCNTYENPDKSTNPNASRCGAYNSFNHGVCNGIHKIGTSNSIEDCNVNGVGIIRGSDTTFLPAASPNALAEHASDGHSKAVTCEHQQSNKCVNSASMSLERERDHNPGREHERFTRLSLDRKITHQQSQSHQIQSSKNDVICAGNNVDCSHIIAFKEFSNTINSNRTSNCTSRGRINETITESNSSSGEYVFGKIQRKNGTHSKTFESLNSFTSQPRYSSLKQNEEQQKQETTVLTSNPILRPSESNAYTASISSTIGSVLGCSDDRAELVAMQGFVRFRAIDDINNAQGIGIHNASIRN
ncbi:uncharacterized protein [Eurosta solidaginis]|uniref:uncharacterized protein isoform X1 n=1 Tax=Eurosta solidaginis TaxID=178769 RepID=UPI0035309E48